MKRIALAVAVVVMAAGACKKAQNSNAADSTRADSMRMADSMKMAPADTTRMGDSTKMRADSARRDTTPATELRVLLRPANTTPAARVAVPSQGAAGHRRRRGRPKPMGKARAGHQARRLLVPTSGRCR